MDTDEEPSGLSLSSETKTGHAGGGTTCIVVGLKLLKSFGKPDWKEKLKKYLSSVKTLTKLYAREREMQRLPVKLADGQEIKLSPGGQNVLVKKIVEDLCSLC